MHLISRLEEIVRNRPRLFDVVSAIAHRDEPLDLFLDKYLLRHGESVFFVQLGANDGLRNDPFRRFIIKGNWSGVFVEPIPESFVELTKNYRYLSHGQYEFRNVAVSIDSRESITLWSICDSSLRHVDCIDRKRVLRKVSFDRQHVVRAARRVGIGEEAIVRLTIPCENVNDILSVFSKSRVSGKILLMDLEGFEEKILSSIDFAAAADLDTIVFEFHNVSKSRSRIWAHLQEYGYSVEQYGGDAVATRRI